jgi:hypothetical protein
MAIEKRDKKFERESEEGPDGPVEVIKGLLKHVKKGSVELQHEASRVRAGKTK